MKPTLKSYEAAEQIDIVNQQSNANSQYACLLGHSCEVRRYPRHIYTYNIYPIYIQPRHSLGAHALYQRAQICANNKYVRSSYTVLYSIYVYIYVCSMVYIARPYILSGVTSMSVFKRRTYHTRQAANSARGRDSFLEFAST